MVLNVRSRLWAEIVISFGLSAFYLLTLVNLENLIIDGFGAGLSPYLFPETIISVLSVMSVLLFFYSCKNYRAYQKNPSKEAAADILGDGEELCFSLGILLYILILFAYLITLYLFGFLYSTPVVIFVVAYLLGLRKIFWGIILSIIVSFALEYSCLHFLKIMLPHGVFFQ